jgi:anti-sigma regulatory factor (Ser/Thr protein kinase)
VTALRVEVEDSGEGFDWRAWEQAQAVDESRASGRGLLIIRSLTRDMSFNERGNCLRFTLPCG